MNGLELDGLMVRWMNGLNWMGEWIITGWMDILEQDGWMDKWIRTGWMDGLELDGWMDW